MKLHGFWRSSATWRVRIALHLKGLDYEYVPVHLARGEQHADEFAQLNPMKHVPVLTLTHAGQTRRVTESLAIIELLEELYPAPALLPSEPFARARARQLALHVVSGIQPLVNTKVRTHVVSQLGVDGDDWVRHWLQGGLAALEALLRESAGRYALGDTLTLADVCLVPQLYMARRVGLSLDAYPTVLAVEAECAKLPAFQRAAPEQQPDAELNV